MRWKRRFALLGVALLAAGCAGSSVSRSEKGDLPKDLSQDLEEKFAVRDVSQGPQPQAQPSPAASLLSNALPMGIRRHHRRRRARRTGYALIGPPAPPFVYPLRRPAVEPIWVGERLIYGVTCFGISAGSFTLEALPFKMLGGRKVYHIRAEARSSVIFNLIYRINDWLETYIDYQGFFSHRYQLHQDETKVYRDSLELYDSERHQSYWWNRVDHRNKDVSESKAFYSMDPFPQDTLSAFYYLRTIPLRDGSEIRFPVMSEGKLLIVTIDVVGREMRETPLGPVRTIKLKAAAATRGVLARKGDSYIWLTDDDRRLLVRMEAKVKVGTVVIRLERAELGSPPATPAEPVD